MLAETYAFFLQAQAQISNGGLFATTPENVKTNIITPEDAPTKAIGWFIEEYGSEYRIIHKPHFPKGKTIIGAYAIATLGNGEQQ
ncbi:MAG: hypothetical protein RLZZ184_3719, partial [Cyanobacteriota bacterium]